MMDADFDYSSVDWTEIEEELEALKVIFPEELQIKHEKPYKLEIQINSNSVAEDNHLKMNLILEIPHNYPAVEIPFMRIKNLTPEYLNGQLIDDYENEIRDLARENQGMQMIFTICEYLREKIADINDKVLDKYNKIMEAKLKAEKEAKANNFITQVDHLTYTPVTPETFGKWCKEWLSNLALQEEANKTEVDFRKTGRQLFMEKGNIDLLKIDEEELENQEFEEDINQDMYESRDDEDDNIDERALYDKELFANEVIDDNFNFE